MPNWKEYRVKYSGGVQTHTLTIRAVSLRAAVRKAYDAAQLKPRRAMQVGEQILGQITAALDNKTQ
jgi:hypothetical protein